jgi:hypothetical protein
MMPGARCLHAYYTYAGRSSSIRAEGAAAMAKCKLDCTETRDIVALNVPLWRGGRQTRGGGGGGGRGGGGGGAGAG